MSDLDHTADERQPGPDLRASVASWLSLLFLLVLLLMAAGGFVRLTLSGLSLPGWPFVNGELLPPMSEQNWQTVYDMYMDDMAKMDQLRADGAVGLGARGHIPTDLGDFKRIYLIEWSHRALAILVGLVGMGCLTVLLRKKQLRELAGNPLKAIMALIVVQSIIGGILVHSFTATHWLFIHLGMATIILGLILWTLLLLLRGNRDPLPEPVRKERKWPIRIATAAAAFTWLQIILGALVAGSRHLGFSTSWPDFNGTMIPTLWNASASISVNLLDNPHMHQWVHRWFAWVVVVAVCAVAAYTNRQSSGSRGRIAVRLALATLFAQILLGLANVFMGAALPIALSHLLIGMLLFCSLVLVNFDLRYEKADPLPEGGRDVVRRPSPVRQLMRDLMVLTKFRINVVGVFTGYTAIALYQAMNPEVVITMGEILACLLGLLLMGGAANTWNQIIERDKDSRMARTKDRRPLPSGRITPFAAWMIALVQLMTSVGIFLGVFGSAMAVALVLFTVFYYVVLYTMWLKPRHYLNIVIGGVPGAMGPVIAWAAMSGSMAWEPIALFGIIFLWTPPHFWALAIRLRDDYKAAGIPMLPVVKGIDETTRQIFIYTIIMVLGTLALPILLPVFRGAYVYLALSVIFGAVFLAWAWRAWRHRPIIDTMPLFHFSILYIGLLFTGLIIDSALIGGGS